MCIRKSPYVDVFFLGLLDKAKKGVRVSVEGVGPAWESTIDELLRRQSIAKVPASDGNTYIQVC